MSKLNSHTPGPWKVFKTWAAITIRNRSGCQLAEVYRFKGGRMEGQDEANANLIAAAPELLKALRDAVRQIHDLTEYDPEGTGGNQINFAKQQEDAIARAEGKLK